MSLDDSTLTPADASAGPLSEKSQVDETPGPKPPVVQVDEARRRKLRPWAIAGAGVVIMVTGGVTLSYTPVFGARVVEVHGEEQLGPRQVLRAADIGLGTNVMHLDEAEIEARLEMERWISDATVETSLPGTIRISVTERNPVMVTELDGTHRMVAGDGTVLGLAPWSNGLPEVAAVDGVPASTDVIRTAGAVVRAMAPALRARVGSVLVAPDGSISLIVDGQVDVRYGVLDSTSAKAQVLRAILEYADLERRGLLSIDVSAPAAPNARFVGSPMPQSVPDPSADVPPITTSPDEPIGTADDAESSASPSVSA